MAFTNYFFMPLSTTQLVNLAQKYGTPLYVYDAEIIARQFQKLKSAYANAPSLKIRYAMKALSNISVVAYLKNLGAQIDAVSIEEVQLALLVGFAPSEIGYTPSGVPFDEIKRAVALGVNIHLDSIPVLNQFGAEYGNSVEVGLRINPNVAAGGNFKISTAHSKSKFGINILQIDDVLAVVKKYDMRITNLHQHTGSEIKDAETFLQVADLILNLAHKFPNLTNIDLGGGFKIAYKPDEVDADIDTIGAAVCKKFNAFCSEYGRELTLVLEPGKYLVAQCGTFLTSATVVKHNPELNFVGIDSGLNHLIRPMMYGSYHPIENISRETSSTEMYNVVGYICETDTFGEARQLPQTHVGDVIAIQNAGAYGFTMASNYNSRLKPAEVFVIDGIDYLIRAREVFDDLLRHQVLLSFEPLAKPVNF